MSLSVRVHLTGPPASGKGTQGRLIAQRHRVTYLSSGEILRSEIAAGTDLGQRVAGIVQAGDLVPDEIILGLLRERLADAVRAGGYVLDGFPRTIAQAHAAYKLACQIGSTVNVVISLDVPADELVRRMHHRATEEHRHDDTLEVLRHRVEVYQEQTAPLLDYYDRRGLLVRVDANRPPQDVTADVFAIVDERGSAAAPLTASSFDPSSGAIGSAAAPQAAE